MALAAASNVDVVVVGAGPAGCAAALRWHQAGARVLIVERQAWARTGGPHLRGVAPHAVEELRALGMADGLRQASVLTGLRMRLVSARGALAETAWPESGARLFVDRARLDDAFRRRVADVGVEHWDRVSAVDPVVDRGRVQGVRLQRNGNTHTVAAQVVVAADGSPSRLAHAAGLHGTRTFHHLYVGQAFDDVEWPGHTFAVVTLRRRGLLVLAFPLGEVRNGRTRVYVELETDLNRMPQAPDKAAAVTTSLANAVVSHPWLSRVLGHARPMAPPHAVTLRGSRRQTLGMPGLFLLGDAAGTLDPLAASGMLMGLQGAAALVAAHARGGAADLERWQRQHHQRMAGVRAYAALLRAQLAHPPLVHAGIRLMQAFPALADHGLGTFNSPEPLRALFRRRAKPEPLLAP